MKVTAEKIKKALITREIVKAYYRNERMNNNGINHYYNLGEKAFDNALNHSDFRDIEVSFWKIDDMRRNAKNASHADYYCTHTARKGRVLEYCKNGNDSIWGNLFPAKKMTKWES